MADGDDALGFRDRGERRPHVFERLRPPAAPAEAPVLDVPHRPPAGEEVLDQPALELEAVPLPPEAAVQEHGHAFGVAVHLAELRRVRPVAMDLRL